MADGYVTKKDLDNALNNFADRILKAMHLNISHAISESEERTKEDHRQYHEESMNRLDEVMGELQNIREDNTIGTYQIKGLREDVDDHEKRINKLEAS